MQNVTHSLLIYRLTGSGVILGSMALAQGLTLFFLSIFGGVIADRIQKKYILFAGTLASSFLPFVIALCLTFGYLSAEQTGSWWILIAAAAFQGTIMGLMQPSREAIIREIVDDKQVMNAVSLATMGRNSFQLIGPAIAGFLVDAFGFSFVYYAVAVTSFLSSIFIIFIPHTRVINAKKNNPLQDILQGFRYVRREPSILLILIFALLTTMLAMPIQYMLAMFTEDVLKVGAKELGLLLSASGFGAMLGSFILASLPSRKRGLLFLLSGMALGLILVGFSISYWWYLSLILMFLNGIARTGKVTLETAMLQSYADTDYRGRVLSLLAMQISFMYFGTFFAGILADSIGVQWSVGGLALSLVIISVVMWIMAPKLRNLD
jgi:MFS family permease